MEVTGVCEQGSGAARKGVEQESEMGEESREKHNSEGTMGGEVWKLQK